MLQAAWVSLIDHYFFPLDNVEDIKRGLRKMQTSRVFAQRTTCCNLWHYGSISYNLPT